MSLSPHRGCGAYSKAALINFFVPDAVLIRGRRLIECGAYSSKYGSQNYREAKIFVLGLAGETGAVTRSFCYLPMTAT